MTTNEGKPKRPVLEACLFLVIVILVGVVVLLFIIPGSKSREPNSVTIHEVYYMCKDAVSTQLKAPTTAKFPDVLEVRRGKISGTENIYRIQGYVDAQNSFGAMIRTEYFCEIEYLGRDWTDWSNWRIKRLVFEE